MSDNTPNTKRGESQEGAQKALREELNELADVVGPGALVDLLLERAFRLRATDIHFDPREAGIRVRIRIDGLLHDIMHLPPATAPNVVSRLKLMSGMDINQRRLAQDGHITNKVLGEQRDIRVGSGPTIEGERLVLRLMPDDSQLHKLEHLGFSETQLEEIDEFLNAPYGMVLAAGPVGSGKSTTMYACLNRLNREESSLVTLEDPVERRIAGINQIQIDPKIDFNFVKALRGILRQDPNVMMVGEIRDPETAHISARAGLTGVVVLSTIHANDTASTIDVFREFEISPMFIAESLRGVISQRLMRRVCEHCQETYQPDVPTCEALGIDPDAASQYSLSRGTGCDACFQTGHFGRVGIFEIMPIRGDIRQAILQGRSHSELMQIAQDRGMMTLSDAARQKVLEGVTSVSEYERVLSFRAML